MKNQDNLLGITEYFGPVWHYYEYKRPDISQSNERDKYKYLLAEAFPNAMSTTYNISFFLREDIHSKQTKMQCIYTQTTSRSIVLIYSVINLTFITVLGALLFPFTSAAPVASGSLATG